MFLSVRFIAALIFVMISILLKMQQSAMMTKQSILVSQTTRPRGYSSYSASAATCPPV